MTTRSRVKAIRQATETEIRQELQRRAKIEITKHILLGLAATTAITAGLIIAPNLTGFICKMLYRQTKNRRYIKKEASVRRVLNRLRRQELVSWREDSAGTVTITLTESGKKRILKYHLDEMSIKAPRSWDGKWRVVIFDIPEDLKTARDVMREKLKNLGLYQLQKSVWVYPHPCQDEVDFVSHVYEVGRYLLYFEAKKLENEEFLKNKFGLTD